MPFARGLSAWSSDFSQHPSHKRPHHSGRRRLLLLLILALLIACRRQTSPPPTATPTSAAAATSTPSPAFWTQAAQSLPTTVLRGISENSPPSLYIRDVLAPAFTKETGIQIDLQISNNSAIEKVIAAGGEDYDFVYVEQDVIYGYLAEQRLANLTQLMNEHRALTAPDFALNNFTSFVQEFIDPQRGDLYGVPIEAFIKVYLYRTDLFRDPALEAAFLDQYHYPLAPAVTFQQYQDIADFFTHYGRTHGLDLWGTTLQATTSEVAAFYEFFETIAPGFGVYNWGINLDRYAATTANGGQLDSEQATKALTFWIDLLQEAPPEAVNSDWNDVATTFAAGRAAQGWVYGEYVAWIATDAARSQVVGKVGVALPPTAPGVMEDATTGAGYLGYYDGAAFGIPIQSQHQAAALLWLQYLGQPAVQPQWAAESGRVVHLSTFDDPFVKAQDRRLNGYYTLMKKQGPLFAGAPPFPFHVQVRNVITPFIHQAIRHEVTPSQALHQAALAVDAELQRLGYATSTMPKK